MKELFFITDIETDGAVPGLHSMRSLGTVCVRDSIVVADFYSRLKPLPDAAVHSETVHWWNKIAASGDLGQKAYHEVFVADALDASEVMIRYDQWIQDMLRVHSAQHAVFIGRPTGFDFTFVRWYLYKFVRDCIFGHRALDLRSLWMGREIEVWFSVPENAMPFPLFSNLKSEEMDKLFGGGYVNPLPHNALEDAKHLANIFINLTSK